MNKGYRMAAMAIATMLCCACAAEDNSVADSLLSDIVETIPEDETVEAIAAREQEAAEAASTEENVMDDGLGEDDLMDTAYEAGTEDSEEIEGAAKSNGYVIVLDPGHSSIVSGNTEPLYPGSSEMKAADAIGTHGNASGLMEYELTLTVCNKAAAALEEQGYTVILTRTDNDHAISCAERAQIANEANADAFLRVHANGVDDTSVTGAMTICITQNNPYTAASYAESSRLSEDLLEEYVAATGRRKERVWYTDSMTGNNWSTVPTTLLEMGYMTNATEDLWMASEEGQEQIVTGIVNGLNTYFGLDVE